MLDEVHIQNIQFPDNDVISNNKYPVKQKKYFLLMVFGKKFFNKLLKINIICTKVFQRHGTEN